jgi:hypothetical protein
MLDARSAIMRCVVDDVGTEAHGHDANGRFSQDTFPGLNRQKMFQRISVVRGPDVSIPSGPAARKRHLSNARDAYTKGQSIEVVSVGTSRPFQEARVAPRHNIRHFCVRELGAMSKINLALAN